MRTTLSFHNIIKEYEVGCGEPDAHIPSALVVRSPSIAQSYSESTTVVSQHSVGHIQPIGIILPYLTSVRPYSGSLTRWGENSG